jgi:16S rRNA (adenine1518-N6/adenine1519-N6)-dimethyltransferase
MMSMSDPASLKRFLEETGLRARKSMSQNFLVDRKVLQQIVKATGLQAGQRVLEIGPGPGALTEAFLGAGIGVTAVELDRGFAQALRERRAENLEIIEGDALQVPLEPLLRPSGIRVVAGNLPYAITTPLLGRFLPLNELVDRVVVMVQKEVADRMCAAPGGKTFGMLSVFAQMYATPKQVCIVPSGAFRPAPKVDSAVVALDLHAAPREGDKALELARIAFQQRRKMVRGTLGAAVSPDRLIPALEIAGIRPEDRPERISVAQWCSLARALLMADTESPEPSA